MILIQDVVVYDAELARLQLENATKRLGKTMGALVYKHWLEFIGAMCVTTRMYQSRKNNDN